MRRFQKWVPYIIGSILFGLSLYILYRGFLIAGENGFGKSSFLAGLPAKVEEMAADTLTGLLTFETETEIQDVKEENVWEKLLDGLFPVVDSREQPEGEKYETETAAETMGSIETDAQTEAAETTETTETTEKLTEVAIPVSANPAIPISPAGSMRQSIQTLPWESMTDFQFLLNHYFILDASTDIGPELLNLEDLMGKNLTLKDTEEGPQILIYHTHSQEAFIDSRPGETADTVVGVGERLKEILEGQYGFSVLHHTKVYDMVDGELDRNEAYNLAAPDIAEILADYPSIEVVIDLHRDGVEGQKFVTEFNGKPTAMIMFYNGLSYTALNGPVDYLPNPYIADNLAFSFQLQMKAAQYYPGFTRNIYLQSLRYNQHLCSKSLLIESGTQLNTVEEEYNAMEPLADILNQVLRGE